MGQLTLNNVDKYCAEGEAFMKSSLYLQAKEKFKLAWNLIESTGPVFDSYGRTNASWLLIACIDACFRAKQFDEGYELCRMLVDTFKKEVLGNSFFHLRCGQIKYELLGEKRNLAGPGSCGDEMARALICGGVDLFNGEDPKYLAFIVAILRPPQGYDSWQDTSGEKSCLRDKLNSAPGYLLDEFTTKFGEPPPYDYVDTELVDDQFEDTEWSENEDIEMESFDGADMPAQHLEESEKSSVPKKVTAGAACLIISVILLLLQVR